MESDAVGFAKVVEPASGKILTARYHELDSLRGLAALTVVFHHFEYMWFPPGMNPKWMRVLAPFTAGSEAVILFFLLSGFVLAIPTLRGKGQPYGIYLIRRILRLYGPYLAALALSLAGVGIWHTPLHLGFWSDATWYRPMQAGLVVQHLLFIGNYPWGEYNTAFWSLIIEMRISLIFPALLWAIRRLRVWESLFLATLCSEVALLVQQHWASTELTIITLGYVSMFIVGILLAVHVSEVQTWFLRQSQTVRWAVGAGSVFFFTFGHKIGAITQSLRGGRHLPIQLWLVGLGASGYMILALSSRPAKWMLNTRPALFLGRISYSLYLVHGTVLFGLTHLLRGRISIIAQLPIYLALSLVGGYAFCIGVEEPFLRLSRWTGRRLTVAARPLRPLPPQINLRGHEEADGSDPGSSGGEAGRGVFVSDAAES